MKELCAMRVLVSNVQRACFHDGPGIRTVIFSMGCSIRCPWCCNPENLTHEIKRGKKHVWGEERDPDEIVQVVLRDKTYFESGGGVTFSGGEFLLHLDEFEPILKSLKEKRINMCVETSLYANSSNIEKAIGYFDLFIIDFKILIKERAKAVLQANVDTFYRNFFLLKGVDYWARIPITKETIDDNNLALIIGLMKKNPPKRIELFKLHNLGAGKYSDLSIDCTYSFSDISNATIESVIASFSSICNNVAFLNV